MCIRDRIIGGSKKRNMAHDLIQYIDSSIFVAKKFDPKKDYRVLLAVDDSPGTKKAVKFGVRVAQAFNIPLDLLTISKKDNFGEGYKQAAARAAKLMRRSGSTVWLVLAVFFSLLVPHSVICLFFG